MWKSVDVPPNEFKDYVCLVNGKMQIASFREFIYDVQQPNWSVDGVTHYLADVPSPPSIAGSGSES